MPVSLYSPVPRLVKPDLLVRAFVCGFSVFGAFTSRRLSFIIPMRILLELSSVLVIGKCFLGDKADIMANCFTRILSFKRVVKAFHLRSCAQTHWQSRAVRGFE
jgi:hypothetical protein